MNVSEKDVVFNENEVRGLLTKDLRHFSRLNTMTGSKEWIFVFWAPSWILFGS